MADVKIPSFVQMAATIQAGLSHQFGQEARLLRAETSQKVSVLTAAGAWAVVGCMLGVFSLGAALAAGVLFLISLGLAPALAALVVAAILASGAATCFVTARVLFRDWTFVPRRTLAAVRADIDAMKKAIANVAS